MIVLPLTNLEIFTSLDSLDNQLGVTHKGEDTLEDNQAMFLIFIEY